MKGAGSSISVVVLVVRFSVTGGTVLIPTKYDSNLPVIYVVTPTYARLVQKAELTRLLHTFLHVSNLHWIVVEDSLKKSELVKKLLTQSKLSHTHLYVSTPDTFKLNNNESRWRKPRGVWQRNEGLLWLRKNLKANDTGVVYFADDDNTYSLELFDEMRYTKKVSVWPVGLVGYLRYEAPIVENGKVSSWLTAWKPHRTFATDMAGFAVNVALIIENKNVYFSPLSKVGEQEDGFLLGLGVSVDDLEPRARNCSEVHVWHTQSSPPNLKNEGKLKPVQMTGYNPNVEI